MCVNYVPLTDKARFRREWQLDLPDEQWPREVFPRYRAPIVRRRSDTLSFDVEAVAGTWGLLPWWAKEAKIPWTTVNARSEEVHTKASYRDAWKRGQRCIVPMEAFYEPNYETGEHVRWRMWRSDGQPMGIAGLWERWRSKDGSGVDLVTFTALTISAEGHALMRRMHKPGDPKRMLVVLDETEYGRWLEAPIEEAAPLLDQYPAELFSDEAAPLPPRGARSAHSTTTTADS
ncbi:SOS response-associated peptidase [Eleftheria terrae]|uniref:SOS response-associated peptidase n=1 Tax=Eleftheria terrae TaxID=1597781 RepID=UPI00263BD34E|nr:SOS response-associated peptidase [Eleftheria terrae]WKB50544.1 SOS response-associated peptidase [Eleftheria terrae]